MTGPDTASQRIRAWINPGIVALLAASFWPFANFINQNRGSYFSLNWILIYFAMVAAIFICLTAVIGALTRKPFARVAAPFAAFIVLFFCYGAMRQAIPGPPKFIIYIWLAIVVLACTLAWLASRHQKASAALLAALLVLVALPTASYLKFIAGTLAAARAQAHLYPAALVRKPNIYFMILDAYARADTLKEVLGFDNQPFIDEVRKLGFFVPERSVSNYPATNLSVSSILSLDYLGGARSLDREVQFRRELLGHNVVVEKLKAEGYRYIVVPSGIWTKISCGGQEEERSAVVQALLEGRLDEANLWEAADTLRIPLRGRYVVIAAQVPGPGRHALPQAEAALKRIGVISAWRLLHDAEVGIAWLPGPRAHLARLADSLHSLSTGLVGVSPCYDDLRDTPRNLRLARIALRSAFAAQRVTVFDRDLFSVAAGSNPEVMRHVSSSILGALDQVPASQRPVLLATLGAWLDNGGSANKAASVLFCHPNTVRHRMRRLEQLTGRSLSDPRGIAELSLAFEIDRRDEPPSAETAASGSRVPGPASVDVVPSA